MNGTSDGHPPLYPLYLRLKGRSCVVVGGGAVAVRKTEALLLAGALVTAVATEFKGAFWKVKHAGLRLKRASYSSGDLEGATLVVAATGNARVNESVAGAARKAGAWVNVCNSPAHSDFFSPAVLQRGTLTFAVGSGGQSPAFTKSLKEELSRCFGMEYAQAGDLFIKASRELQASGVDRRGVGRAHKALVELNLPEVIRSRGTEQAWREVKQCISAF